MFRNGNGLETRARQHFHVSPRPPSDRRPYLVGGGLSVLAHLVVLWGTSSPLPRVHAAVEPRAGVVWIEASASGGVREASSAASTGRDTALPALSASARPGRSGARHTSRAPASRRLGTVSDAASDADAATGPAEGAESTTADTVLAAGVAGTVPSGGSATTRGTVGQGSAASGPTPGSGATDGPRLLTSANPCAGFFPAGAHVAHGRVQVHVEVGADGHAASTRVLAEEPRGEGFGGAARACADRLRFTPAHTSQGTPVGGHARLLLSFHRS